MENGTKQKPGNWNGIDAMVYNLANECLLPDTKFKVQIGKDVYIAKGEYEQQILTVKLYKNEKLISIFVYDNESNKVLSEAFKGAN